MSFTIFIVASLVLMTEGAGIREKRSVGQFGDMIRYATGREALLYNDYGNHCGYSADASLPRLDAADECCFVHDRCYERAAANECSSSWFGMGWVRHSWAWDPSASSLSCHDSSGSCDLAACSCDRAAARCLAGAPYNSEHKKRNAYDKFADLRFKAFKVFGTWFP